MECLALKCSDGSLVLVPDADIKQMRRERRVMDSREKDPSELSDIVRVRYEIIETVEANASPKP